MKIGFLILLLIVFSCIDISFAEEEIEHPEWTCYDHVTNYVEYNPDWRIVVFSTNPRFKLGYDFNHFLVYKFNEDKTMTTIDVESGRIARYKGWEMASYIGTYMHFFDYDETPTRHWGYLKPNAEAVYNAL